MLATITPIPEHTGRQQDCAPGSTLVDADGDGWGGCFLLPVLPASTLTPPPSSGPPVLDPAEVSAALVPAAKAWLLKPSGPAYDALAAAAKAFIDVHPLVPQGPFNAPDDNLALIAKLETYPGSDSDVADTLQGLAGVLPGLPPIVSDGTYTVGQNFAPGTYRTLNGVDGCYWETLNSAGDINDNNFIDGAPQVIMHVRSRDFAVHIEGCGWWVRTG